MREWDILGKQRLRGEYNRKKADLLKEIANNSIEMQGILSMTDKK